MKYISIVTPCYNEEMNVEQLYTEIREVFARIPGYRYEHLFIDNASNDKTVAILKTLAAKDRNVKIIVNARNFGPIRSCAHGLFEARGDAVMLIVADLQDPPELIPEFIKKWEKGLKIVIGIKKKSMENKIMFSIRKLYYNIVQKTSEIDQVKNFTGFGLYDKAFIEIIRKIDDPYPYFRGLITEIGFERAEIEYTQPRRKKGRTKTNFYSLWEIAMLGIISNSKMPIRLSSFIGFFISIASLFVAILYFVYKILHWSEFSLGIAPLVIGLFFFGAVQLFCVGMIGEYVGAIYTQVKHRPLVIEKERVNFD